MSLDRSTAPKAGMMQPLSLPAYTTHHMSNGLAVHLLPYGTNEVVEVQWIFKAGKNYQTLAGQAHFTLRNLQEGTASYTSLALAQQLDQYGAWLNQFVGEEILSLSLATVSSQLSNTLPLLSEVVLSPQFPEREFEQMKARSRQNFETSSQKTTYQARRAFGHLLYGENHPYGLHFGKDEVEALNLAALRQYYQ